MNGKKRRETSKIVVAILLLFAFGITVYSCVLMWHTEDTSGLAYLIPSTFGLAATAVGFYFWKAKAENLIKLAKLLEPDKPKRKKASDTPAAVLGAAIQQSLQQTIEGFFSDQNDQ
jgi:hypothetical protein